jgi:hypothetical protein
MANENAEKTFHRPTALRLRTWRVASAAFTVVRGELQSAPYSGGKSFK